MSRLTRTVRIKGKLSANQIEGDIVKTVSKAFPRDVPGTGTVASQGPLPSGFSDDQTFDRQIVIPAVVFSGA